MKTQALKLEIQHRLALTDDSDLLTKLKRNLEMLLNQEDRPINSGSVLKEPEPITVLRAEVKRLVDEMGDTAMLSRVLAFLRGEEDDLLWRSVLSARATRAEADFDAGIPRNRWRLISRAGVRSEGHLVGVGAAAGGRDPFVVQHRSIFHSC